MKVLSFSHAYNGGYSPTKFLREIWKRIFPDKVLINIQHFYEQSFSLELVNKLFDCTNYDGKDYLEVNDIPIQIIEYRKVECYKAIIDNFITDCQRLGIELQRREK